MPLRRTGPPGRYAPLQEQTGDRRLCRQEPRRPIHAVVASWPCGPDGILSTGAVFDRSAGRAMD